MASIQTPITDLDDLLTSWIDNGDGTYDSSEINIDAINKTFDLKAGGNLAVAGSGVTGQALYSFFKNRWKNVASITKYDFPMVSITNEQFEFADGWKPANDTTRKKLRTCGWAEIDADGSSVGRQYAGIVTLGSLGLTDQPYFAQDSGITASTTNTDFTGPVNEAVQIFGDTGVDPTSPINSDLSGYFKIYVRERAKIYADADLPDIGVSAMTTIVYRFPVSNGGDLKITTSADTEIDAAADGMPADTGAYATIDVEYLTGTILGAAAVQSYSINDVVQDGATPGRWYICTGAGTLDATDINDMGVMAGAGTSTWSAFSGERQIKADGTYGAFNIILDANNAGATPGATKEEVYEWAQWALRLTGTIDTGTSRNGNVADTLVSFVGDTLHTAAGVVIDDIAAADLNNIVMHDYSDATHSFPSVVTVTLNFNGNLSSDTDSVFYVYYDNVPSGNFGDSDAIQVKDKDDNDVGSTISNNVPDGAGGSSFAFSYAYDGDTTGGRTQSTPTDIVAVAVGLNTGQYVKATGQITAGGATLSLVAPLERNYSDPV